MKFLDQEYVAVAIALFIPLYALSLSRIKLPDYIQNLFGNTIFRIVFLSLLLIFRFDNAPHLAFAIALIFVLTMENISTMEVKENFNLLSEVNKLQ